MTAQREIKFRAWDTVLHRMYSPHVNPKLWHDLKIEPFSEVMQYTGLKDKNGTEIYEGDIVRRFDGSHHGFPPRIKKVGWISTRRYQGFNIGNGESEWYAWTVIGNVYENPELLETSR